MRTKPSNINIERPNKNTMIIKVKPVFIYCIMIFAIVLILFLLLLSLSASSINLNFDKYASDTFSIITCQLVRKDLWGLRKQESKIVANNYQSIIEEDNDIEGSTSRIVFQLKSGENIPLASWTDSFDGKDKIFKHIRKILS